MPQPLEVLAKMTRWWWVWWQLGICRTPKYLEITCGSRNVQFDEAAYHSVKGPCTFTCQKQEKLVNAYITLVLHILHDLAILSYQKSEIVGWYGTTIRAFTVLSRGQMLVFGLGFNYMGGCPNYGPFLGTLNIRCRIIIGIKKKDP